MFRTKVVQEINTHILCSVTFFKNRAFFWDNVENIVGRADHIWQYCACALHVG